MLDAYSIKKIVPRLLLGIILINLSFYLVVFATDMTRVVANGAGSLISKPFVDSGSYNFSIGDKISGTQIAAVLIGGFLVDRAVVSNKDAITGTIGGIFKAQKGTRSGVLFRSIHIILALIVIPIGLILLAIMVTLIFRQGLLIFLAITAPIACALYILPSTEKFFKQWLQLFFKTLLMYPIIMVIFALSNVLASIIFKNNPGSLPGLIAGLIAMFAPLALIPFAFKFAGGALGAIHGVLTTARGKLGEKGPLQSYRERNKQEWQKIKTQEQAAAYRRATDALDPSSANYSRGRFGRFLATRKKAAIGPGIYEREGLLNKAELERSQAEIDFGDDTRRRASTAILHEEEVRDEEGNVTGTRKVYRSLAGKEFSEEQVMSARRATANDQYQIQRNIAYEIGKAMLEENHDNLVESLPALQEQLGVSGEVMNSALIGAGFQMKGKGLQWKRLTTYTEGGKVKLRFDGAGTIQEHHATSGTYQGLAYDADQFRTLAMLAEEVRTSTDPNFTPEMRERRLTELKEIAQGMKSQIATAGGTAQAYQLAMQQTGQDTTPGGSAEASKQINRFITLMDNVDYNAATDTVEVATTVNQVLNRPQVQARIISLQQEDAQLNQEEANLTSTLTAGARGAGNTSPFELAQARSRQQAILARRQAIQNDLRGVNQQAINTVTEVQNILQAARVKRNKRKYGKITLENIK